MKCQTTVKANWKRARSSALGSISSMLGSNSILIPPLRGDHAAASAWRRH
jgi:hypothetical protein